MVEQKDDAEAKRSKPGAATEEASSSCLFPVQHGKTIETKVLSNAPRVMHPCVMNAMFEQDKGG